MPENVMPGPVCDLGNVREAVCIHTRKIFDSCRDKDCVEDLRFYPTAAAQEVLSASQMIKGGTAELLYVYTDVEPVTFNRGFYSVDMRFYYRVTLQVCTGTPRYTEVEGLCVFDKRCILFGSEGEYAKILGIPAPGFDSKSAADGIDRYAYDSFCKEISKSVPRCKHIYIALRNVLSSEHHTLAGALHSNGTTKFTRVYDINNIIDCIGVGDAFVGALLYAHTVYDDDQKRVDFAAAASALKNTIAGDYNMMKAAEIESLVEKGESGEVSR